MPAPGLVRFEARNAPLRGHENARAIALSILLHAVLFLALLGDFRLDRPGPSPQIVIPLEVRLVDGRELLNQDPSPAEGPALPATEQVQRASTAAAATASAPTAVASSHSEPAPGLPQERDPQTRSDESISGEAPAPRDSELLARSDAPRPDVPPPSNDPAEPLRIAIPVSQQTMLVRRIREGLRNFEDPSDLPARFSWRHEGEAYTAILDGPQPSADTDIELLSVEVRAQEEGRRMRTRLQMKRLAFSHYTQLVDRWDMKVQLHDDEIVGRFHSNSSIVIGYDAAAVPRFLGRVSTAARRFDLGDTMDPRQRIDIFRDGLETGAQRIPLPKRFLRPPGSGAHAHTFLHDTRIVFFADGSYEWTELRGPAMPERRALPSPAYLFGGRRTTLYLRGEVAGQVTVYSSRRIVIEGDLTYANDPRDKPGAGDCLGLVSDGDIEIARPNVTGPGNLEIEAALYARRRFIVTETDTPSRATLIILGSLTAGSLTATEPRYATQIRFDERFERLRPPGFPGTRHYEIEAWDPAWEYQEGSEVPATP